MDPRRVVHDPGPKSRTGAVRIIGYSPSAGFVVTVIATGGAHAGVTAWKSSGAGCAGLRGAGMTMADQYAAPQRASQRGDDAVLAAEVRAVREEYAEEEAEAA